MTDRGDTLAIHPRDGLRRRFDVVVPDRGLPFGSDFSRLKIELSRDGFAAGGDVTMAKSLATIGFAIENRTSDAHTTDIRLSMPVASKYQLTVNGKPVTLEPTGDWDYPYIAHVEMAGTAPVAVAIARVDR
jgi:hypothetical protein